jgi:outer membrane protein TolC
MALEEAEMNSPNMRQARLQLEQSRQNLLAQRASLKSKFSLGVTPISYGHRRSFNEDLGEWITTENTAALGSFSVVQPITLTDGTVSLRNNLKWQDSYSSLSGNQFKGFSNDLSLRIDQPIFTYNRTKMALKELELAYENSQLYYAIQMLTVEKSVTSAFYSVHQAQQDLEIGKEEYANRKISFEIIQNKVEAGLSAQEEAFQAELDLLTSESNLYNKEVALENIRDNFKQMLGMPLDEEVVVLAEVNVNYVQVNLKLAIERGVSSRMELRQRQIDIEQGLFRITETKAFNEFKGDVSLNLGLFGENEKFPNIYETPVNNQDISVSFTVPIYDWGEKKARMRAAQAAQESRVYNLDDEKINISLDIRKVVRELVNLQNQIVIATKNEENATRTYDINLEKYKNGDLTSMDLNLVQNQLTQQKQNLTNALIQYKLGLLDLKIQTLYDYEKEIPVIPDLGQ